MKKIWFLFICGMFAATVAFAEDVQVTSTFDKRQAQVGEEIHLTIRIVGAEGNVQAPRLPAFKNFDTFYTGRASHITFINGQSSSSVEFSYALVPRESGSYTLDPIEVSVNSRRFATNPVEIQVTDAAGGNNQSPNWQPPAPVSPVPPVGAGASQQSQQNPYAGGQAQNPAQEPAPAFRPDDENIFIRAWVDKTTVYPNEQILLTYSLYTRYDTRYEGFEQEPQVSGFWIEEFPMEREVQRETVRVEGKRYVKADIRKMALFPTADAEYTIEPGTLKASIRQEPQTSSVFDEFFDDSFFSGGSFFARRENRILKPAPIKIQVRPFPEQGKPKSFQGATGNFRMTATLDKTTVKQNEPVTMKLIIEGEGNVETLNKPKTPEMPGFKTYDADTSSQLFKTGNVIGGRKTFEIVFIPTEAGAKKISKMEFSYFDPVRGVYNTVSTPEFTLNVTPSEQTFKLPTGLTEQESFKKEIQSEGKDIRFIMEKLPTEKRGMLFDYAFRGLVMADILLTLLVFFGLARDRQEKIFAKNSALKRRKIARAQAESRMRRLKIFSKAEEPGAYFDEVEKILTEYLSHKFNLSAHGITRYELDGRLEQALGANDPLLKEIRDLYALCEESRFAKAAVPAEMKAKAIRILRDTIGRVERLRR